MPRALNLSLRRRLLASAASVAAAVPLPLVSGGDVYAVWLPSVLLLLAAGLLHLDRLPQQILVRAIWWQALLLGLLCTLFGRFVEVLAGSIMAPCAAVALLALGRAGLVGAASARSKFAPQAFFGLLVLALAMALADASTLTLWLAVAIDRGRELPLLLPICAGVMIVAVIGIYRLKVWALLLNLLANLAIAALALSGELGVPHGPAWALAATAGVQLLLPIPLVVAFFRKVDPRSPTISLRAYVVTAAVVVVIALAAAIAALQRYA